MRLLSGLAPPVVLLIVSAASAAATDCSIESSDAATEQLMLAQRADDGREASLAALQKLIDTCRERTVEQPRLEARWLEAKWLWFLLEDRHADAESTARKALTLLLQAPNVPPQEIVEARAHLAYSLESRGRIAAAQWHLRQGVVVALTLPDKGLLGDEYFRLADTYRKLGQLKVARRFFEAAHAAYMDAARERERFFAQMKLGSLDREQGDIASALAAHTMARDYFAEHRLYRELVAEIELARDHLARCRSVAPFESQHSDEVPSAPCDLDLAAAHADAALDDARALDEQKLDAATLRVAIENERLRTSPQAVMPGDDRRLREVQALLQRSELVLATPAARPHRQIEFAREAIRYYTYLADIASVERYGDKALALVRHVAGELTGAHDNYLAWMQAAQPFMTTYVSALYALDRTRLLSLLETYYPPPTRFNARLSGLTEAQSQAAEIERHEAYLKSEQSLVDAEWGLERAETATEREAAQAWLRRARRSRDISREQFLGALKEPTDSTTPRLATGAQPLPKPPTSEAYVRYFVQEPVSFIVIRAGDETRYFDLPSRSEVRALVENALASLENRNATTRARREALKALRRLMPWQSAHDYGPIERLVIVPDDAVHEVPFSAIPLDSDDPRDWLGSYVQIVRTSSLHRYYGAPPGRLSSTPNDIVIFADPVFESTGPRSDIRHPQFSRWIDSLDRLHQTAREAQRIANLFPTAAVALFLREHATANVLLSQDVRNAKVLHIATHGYFNPATPDIVGIAATALDRHGNPSDGFISATRLLTSRFNSNLIVISGCDTMRGPHYSGQRVNSISQGFLAQGAGSVVGTLWKVSDHSAAQFIEVFYRELLNNGGDTAAALQKTRLAGSRKGTGDPRDWGAFVLESSNRQITHQVF